MLRWTGIPVSVGITITATGLDPRDDAFRTELHAAGCEDAEITFRDGRIVLNFDREALSLDVALMSAMWDVQRSGATVESVAARPCGGTDELVPLAAEHFDALTKAINGSSLDALLNKGQP